MKGEKMSKKIIAVICFCLCFASPVFAGKVVDKTLAIVNGEAIMYSEFEKTINPVMEQYKQSIPAGEQSEAKIKEFKQKLLDQMIDDRLLRQIAKEKKIVVTKRELEEGIKQVKSRFSGDEDFQAELKKEDLTEAKFSKRIEEQLMVMKLIESEMKTKAKQPSDKDIKDYYDKIITKMSGKSLGLDEKEEADIESLAKYFKRLSSEQVRAKHILVKLDKNASMTEKSAALSRIKRIREEYVKGESFDKLAEKNSEDTGSAAKGGDLGYFTKGDMVPEFEKAAFSLNVGEVSEPILTDFGYHIIRVEEKKAAKTLAFDDVKNDLKELLYQKSAQKYYESWIKEQRAKANIKVNALE
jgi:parvulin-like peptidyl-prolyl isomerase